MKVLAFGEILWDIIEGTEHLGGAPFNFAAHIAQCGNESFIVSRLATDALGERAFNKSKEYGVDVSLLEWDEHHPTGTVDVILNDGQPDYTIHENVAYDFIHGEIAVERLKKENFHVFYFGSLAQRNHVSATALKKILSTGKFSHIFYDVNLRKGGFTVEVIKRSLSLCTIFKLNADEVRVIAELLTGSPLPEEEFCKRLKTSYPNIQLILVTASDKGCYLFLKDQLMHIPGEAVQVVDAVGAGDAFSASFMHVYGSSGDAIAAAHVANQVGAYVATKRGAIPEYSSEIRSLINQSSYRQV